MLMIAEGTLNRPVTQQEHRLAAAWLVPMPDARFLHGGWNRYDLTAPVDGPSAPRTWQRRSNVSTVYPSRGTKRLPSPSPE